MNICGLNNFVIILSKNYRGYKEEKENIGSKKLYLFFLGYNRLVI